MGQIVSSPSNVKADVVDDSFLFTSESVGEGHPDKICDQISDAVLDACLKDDPLSKVAVEAAVKPGFVFVFGVVTTLAVLDVQSIVRKTLREIGYDQPDMEIDCETCEVVDAIDMYRPSQLTELPLTKSVEACKAGDQGIMFGYATDETASLLPMTVKLAHDITKALKTARTSGKLPWLRADTKAQVTIRYSYCQGHVVPQRIVAAVVSVQHDRSLGLEKLRSAIKDQVLKNVLPAELVDENTAYHIQPSGDEGIVPSGKFAGLTGRKIIVDTYGGWGSHGGGAFSGKDFRQVDRSGAYLARWIAKSIVASSLARRCSVQISYAIGIVEPVSIFIDTYGTGVKSSKELESIVFHNFDMRPGSLALQLDLMKPIFAETARNGHFSLGSLPWEKSKQLLMDGIPIGA